VTVADVCTSMVAGIVDDFSINMRSSPNAGLGPPLALPIAGRRANRPSATMRMPRPPPPAEALTRTGNLSGRPPWPRHLIWRRRDIQGHQLHAGSSIKQFSNLDFEPIPYHAGGWADETILRRGMPAANSALSNKKAVAGMHRIGPLLVRGGFESRV